jgi:hypothetical protein
MTAPAAVKEKVPFKKIPIFHRFPATPEWEEMKLAGLTVERGRLCACGQRFFAQSLVNPEYLDSLRGDQSKMYVDECCEIEKIDKAPGFRIWTPSKCFQCLRRDMNPPRQADLLHDRLEERYK